MNTSERLKYSLWLNKENSFVDFIKNHERYDMKDFYLPPPTKVPEETPEIPEIPPLLKSENPETICKHKIHGVCKCRLLRMIAARNDVT
jgi:hypothetical protein